MAKKTGQEPEVRSVAVSIRITPGEAEWLDDLCRQLGPAVPLSRSDAFRYLLQERLRADAKSKPKRRPKK